jgi:glycosyltransferase involved in cell wall biosynthesis
LAEIHADLRLDPPAPLVIYTGRLHEAKGLLDAISAWPAVVASHPTARLWLVGDGPLRRELLEAVAVRGLGESIRLPGAFDNVEEMLDAADVFVLPSYVEGMSLALLEAMAAGLPVVASDIDANRTLVEHERHGLLVPPREPSRLAAAVRRLLERQELAQQLGESARRRVEAEFSLESAAARHLELFARLIAEKRDRA